MWVATCIQPALTINHTQSDSDMDINAHNNQQTKHEVDFSIPDAIVYRQDKILTICKALKRCRYFSMQASCHEMQCNAMQCSAIQVWSGGGGGGGGGIGTRDQDSMAFG